MTALPNWGSLSKSTTDDTTIDSAISNAIDNHDSDSAAHLGAGASLAAHKSYKVIDHPAGSIVGDKFQRTHVISTSFNGIGGITSFGHVNAYFGALLVYTDSTTGAVSQASGSPNWFEPIDWSHSMYTRIVAKIPDVSNMEALLGVGCDDLGDGYTGFGFKIINGLLYAYHAEDTGNGAVFTTIEITGYVLSDWNTYEVIFNQELGTLVFFINGTQVASFDSGLPTSLDDNAILLQVKTNEAVEKDIYASSFFMNVDY